MANFNEFQITTTLRYDPGLVDNPITSEGYPSPVNSPYYLLGYHRDRLLSAASSFGWNDAIAFLARPQDEIIESLARKFDEHIPAYNRVWRLRVLIDHKGRFTIEAAPTTPFTSHILIIPRSDPRNDTVTFSNLSQWYKEHQKMNVDELKPWALYIDSQPTQPSAFTTHKTTARDSYSASRERTGIKSPQDKMEVLIYNPIGEVMEGSITTIYFQRRGTAQQSENNWVTPPLVSGGNAATSRRYALETGLCIEEVVRVDDLVDGEDVWLSNGARGFIPAVLKLKR